MKKAARSHKTNVALAHHWLVAMRGGEKVLEQFSLIFPGAPIYTLVFDFQKVSKRIISHEIIVSALGWLPWGNNYYKHSLPFFPIFVGSMKVDKRHSLVLTSDASMMKGIKVPQGVPHVCYCHSPPRYLWDVQESYAKAAGWANVILKKITPVLRSWDWRCAQKVTHFIANSQFVAKRIQRAYGRESVVIYPPVAIRDFIPNGEDPDDFYLVLSQLVPYKRIDIAVEAFNRLGKKLIIIGEGSDFHSLKSNARSNITFLGSQPFKVVKEHYARCRALIFPGIEDFGITPVEAQASGRPVIAFGQGGALETVQDGQTGLFFPTQSADALIDAVLAFEKRPWDAALCRANAERFSEERFREEMVSFFKENKLLTEGISETLQEKKLRLAVVAEPGIAGVKTHVMDILQNIDTTRFEVLYIYSTTRSDQSFLDEIFALQQQGIICKELPMTVELRPWKDLLAIWRLLRELRAFRPDVLHLHSSKASGLGRVAALFLRPRPLVVYTPNAMACFRSKSYLWLERFLGIFTDILIAVTPSEKSDFIKWKIPGANRSQVITVGVRPVSPSRARTDAREFLVGACGRISYQKNPLLFFQTALQLIRDEPQMRFRWIGSYADDQDAEAVKQLLEQHGNPPQIEITGWVSDPQQQLVQLDLFCMLSRYESFGYVTAEAMLMGVPVIATRATGTIDLVKNMETGIMVELTPAALAVAILRLRDDDLLRNRLAQEGQRFISQKQTLEQMRDDMERIYTRGS